MRYHTMGYAMRMTTKKKGGGIWHSHLRLIQQPLINVILAFQYSLTHPSTKKHQHSATSTVYPKG